MARHARNLEGRHPHRLLRTAAVLAAGLALNQISPIHEATDKARNEIATEFRDHFSGHQNQASPAHDTKTNTAPIPIGFYPGDMPDKVDSLKKLAQKVHLPPSSLDVTLMTSTADPQTMGGNGWGLFKGDGSSKLPHQWQTITPHPNLTISVPLAFGAQDPNAVRATAGLMSVASGADDGSYLELINYVVNAGYNNITWRLGWEFDGDWMPWSTKTSPNKIGPAFVAAYQHIHDLIKIAMPASKFDWCGSAGYDAQWTAAYPGDNYVDVIGMDVYDNLQGNFAKNVQPYLEKHEAFAKAHGKPVSFPEWGLGLADNPDFINNMAAWFRQLPRKGPGSLAAQAYFNANEPPINVHSILDDNPHSEAAFIANFGHNG